MTQAKQFQIATANSALKALQSRNGTCRFLVADEVGLGKTVVAQRIIDEMIKEKQRGSGGPLIVFYVCSSLAIAAQNRRKLLESLPPAERQSALCPVDRLTLVSTKEPPSHPRLHLYTLTPDTSIPVREGRSRRGQQTERALIFALLKYRFPKLLRTFRQEDFRQKEWIPWPDPVWTYYVRFYKRVVRSNASLRREFYGSLREEFGLKDGQWILPALAQARDSRLELIGRLRSALAAANLNRISPDLVIFDEFQRFRDLIQEYDDLPPSRVLRLLRGEEMEDAPGLLLLSATPYKPYVRRWEEADGSTHRQELLDLIQFLYGGRVKASTKRRDIEKAFETMENELRLGRLDSAEFQGAKSQIEKLLRPVMARTERLAHPDGEDGTTVKTKTGDLHAKDVRVYKHLASTFREEDRSWAVPFWSSVPLPAQTMGPGYLAWKRRLPVPKADAPEITEEQRNSFHRPPEWPHPRLRAIESLAPAEKLVLPWIAPSLPWWPLGGHWKGQAGDLDADGKVLVFSHFRAVPQAIAAFLSYSLECHFMRQSKGDYEAATKRSVLQARPKREALVALFHPSPWLSEITEPLSARQKGHTEGIIRKELTRQIRASLVAGGIRIGGETRRPIWRLIARIESRLGYWRRFVFRSWRDLGYRQAKSDDTEAALAALIEKWNEEAVADPIAEISPIELDRLALHALSAPGVVLGRALRRHWPEAICETGFKDTLEACWLGLRSYFDQPWFVKSLGGGERHFPESIQKAIVEGNLESVLDEQLWLNSTLNGLEGSQLAEELRDVLRLRSSVFYVHSLNSADKRFTIRCHAALPFTEGRVSSQRPGEAEEKPLRPDELRKAFNSPFWPHVLATTSIGQEGLDFHCWCKTLVHWDLASDPVSHEQRQGRIQRYAGLAIRTAIAQQLGAAALAGATPHTSPWMDLAGLAESNLADRSGLKPWWILPGAKTENILFTVPTSEQEARFKWLQEQVLLYRLTLGHPNQEDLLELLRRNGDLSREQIRKSSLELSAYFGGSSADPATA
jgi:hypothetical protein